MTIVQALKQLFGISDEKATVAEVLAEAEIDSGLPEVTAGDNGKVLKVVEGVWAPGTDNGMPAVTSADSQKGLVVNLYGQWQTTNQVGVFSTNYNGDTLLEGKICYKDSSNNSWCTRTGTLLPAAAEGNKGKTIKGNPSTGAFELVAFPEGLPAVTAADNGKILKVVDGAWAAVTP